MKLERVEYLCKCGNTVRRKATEPQPEQCPRCGKKGTLTRIDNRLSMAAGEIWNQGKYEWQDYAMDGSGDCGPLIAKGHQISRIAILERWGYTPQEYNQELRDRMCGEEYPKMSYNVFCLLGELEVEPMDEWLDHNTVVCTLGYPGHPGAEYSTLAYLKAES